MSFVRLPFRLVFEAATPVSKSVVLGTPFVQSPKAVTAEVSRSTDGVDDSSKGHCPQKTPSLGPAKPRSLAVRWQISKPTSTERPVCSILLITSSGEWDTDSGESAAATSFVCRRRRGVCMSKRIHRLYRI